VMRSLHKRLVASRRRQWRTPDPPLQPAGDLERTNEPLVELEKVAKRWAQEQEQEPKPAPTVWDRILSEL
jgi:hypothetical protein